MAKIIDSTHHPPKKTQRTNFEDSHYLTPEVIAGHSIVKFSDFNLMHQSSFNFGMAHVFIY